MTETSELPRLSPLIVIPARLASVRLPNKPLLDIAGAPMIVHVWRRALAAEIGPVLVAAADRAIADAIEAAGGRAVLTDPDHPSGSDRINEAVESYDATGRYDVIVNLQGDLPTVPPATVRAALAPLVEPDVDIGTVAAPIAAAAERDDPNVVKAVVEPGSDPKRGRALYFSRAPVPWGEGPYFHHIGIYAYRRAALARFVSLPRAVLERRERLEQLRALAAGLRIDVAVVDEVPPGVDTPADLDAARRRLGGGSGMP